MKIIPLVILGLGVTTPVLAEQRVFIQNGNMKFQTSTKTNSQTTSISVNTTELTLIPSSTAKTQIKGVIKINGREISKLTANTSIDLSPYLRVGNQVIQISGIYTPANTSVGVQLLGPNTQVSLSSSGNGTLNQTINLNVQGEP